MVGRFIVEHLLEHGYTVVAAGRTPPDPDFFSRPVAFRPLSLEPGADERAAFSGIDAFVHAAFAHVPGRYRGGEGGDPEGFVRRNVAGSLARFAEAKAAGVARAVFLSSRAVYDGIAPGTVLTEDMTVAPTSLYGQIKRDVETGLAFMASDSFLPVSLRATGVHGPAGPGQTHKWAELFAAFARGDVVTPRVATEVHGDDLASVVRLVLTESVNQLAVFGPAPVLNVSDILLDHHDLLAAFSTLTGVTGPMPGRSDASAVNAMDCARLVALGWRPRGRLDLTGMT